MFKQYFHIVLFGQNLTAFHLLCSFSVLVHFSIMLSFHFYIIFSLFGLQFAPRISVITSPIALFNINELVLHVSYYY